MLGLAGPPGAHPSPVWPNSLIPMINLPLASPLAPGRPSPTLDELAYKSRGSATRCGSARSPTPATSTILRSESPPPAESLPAFRDAENVIADPGWSATAGRFWRLAVPGRPPSEDSSSWSAAALLEGEGGHPGRRAVIAVLGIYDFHGRPVQLPRSPNPGENPSRDPAAVGPGAPAARHDKGRAAGQANWANRGRRRPRFG